MSYPDISHYHPITSWTTVKKNCPFLISKATEGTSFVDTTLNSFIKGCETNKIPYWLYVFLRKGNELAQAKFMVSTCQGKIGSYFRGYILDVESGNAASDVRTALDYLSGLGVKTMIYTMYSQYSAYQSVIAGRPSTCAWWEARYGNNDGSYSSKYPCHSGVDLHQYTDQGNCSGISGKADLNRLTGTKAESWFTGADAKGGETATDTTTAEKEDTEVETTTKIKINGTEREVKRVLLDGHNYLRMDELGDYLPITIGYDGTPTMDIATLPMEIDGVKTSVPGGYMAPGKSVAYVTELLAVCGYDVSWDSANKVVVAKRME
ncbi:MAG: glycoside hydrolase family 25 protein [Clostridia bacterium]|nr:glycoside hydrolase family 25 protein [Clostridia bacterium]